MSTTGHWEHFPHGADVGIRGIGPTAAEAFAQAALAMTAVVTPLERIEPRLLVRVECSASGLELLFFDWIDTLVFEMATGRCVFGAFDVQIEDHRLIAVLHGEPVDRAKHEPAIEIKGPTFTELHVSRSADGTWCAQCVVDV